MLLQMFTGPLTAGINAISANQGLLVFKKVQPIDPFIARFIFQLFANTLAPQLFFALLLLVGHCDSLSSNYL